MSVVVSIKEAAARAVTALYQVPATAGDILVNATKPEFEGEYTVVLFAFVKQVRKAPEAIGNELGRYLLSHHADLFSGYNVIKGFLNLSITTAYWTEFLTTTYGNSSFGLAPATGKKVMVEYSSPNTNKPLHLGHLRNNFLGWSAAEILKAAGNDVVKTCIVNDRGIHICKSMIAWQRYANGATPQSAGQKGDHFVGDYYVLFETDLKAQAADLLERMYQNDLSAFDGDDLAKASGLLAALQKATAENNSEKQGEIKDELKELARSHTPIMHEAKKMLLQWEQGDPQVLHLWRTMNGWVYQGFEETYKKIGSDFRKTYYESDTYLLGKDLVDAGLQQGVLYRKPDGSVWIDLTSDGLDEKLVLRKDGTSVYITQDLGLAQLKYHDFGSDESLYVIADEQIYHMKVLKLILQKLGAPYASGIIHLSYGLVELPFGKMKSREGTVVDADDIVVEMEAIARAKTEELGKVDDFTGQELDELYSMLGLGALKFFLLRVDPKKRIVFNPEESIDFHGFTGPFVQYTHARIKSILRKMSPAGTPVSAAVEPLEKEMILLLEQFPTLVSEAAHECDPSKVALYLFNLAKTFNSFYAVHSVAKAESDDKKELRLQLCTFTANTIKTGMHLLGIRVPERM